MSHDEIHKICKEHGIENYTINDDNSIDVDGQVDLFHDQLTILPLKFNIVNGNFDCGNNYLKSLNNAPSEVYGDFYCDKNELESLEGAPMYIKGDVMVDGNKVKLDYDKYIKIKTRLSKLEKLKS